MRRAWITVLLCLSLPAVVSAIETRGSWHITTDRGVLHLDLSSVGSHWGHSTTLNAFTGLTEAQMQSATEVPVQFDLVREAGTIHFSGNFANVDGVGRFKFTPNSGYAATLSNLGVSIGDTSDETLFSLAMHDVSTSFIREMQSLGLRGDAGQYITFRIHGVTAQFVREMKDLGYAD